MLHTCPKSSGILHSDKFLIYHFHAGKLYRYINKVLSNRFHVRQWENTQKTCVEVKLDKTSARLETSLRNLCPKLYSKAVSVLLTQNATKLLHLLPCWD